MTEQNGGSRLDRIEKLIEKSEKANKAAHERIEKDLRKWVKIGVAEGRKQRKRAEQIDENVTRLAAAQLVTEEKLQRFLSSALGRSNGH